MKIAFHSILEVFHSILASFIPFSISYHALQAEKLWTAMYLIFGMTLGCELDKARFFAELKLKNIFFWAQNQTWTRKKLFEFIAKKDLKIVRKK